MAGKVLREPKAPTVTADLIINTLREATNNYVEEWHSAKERKERGGYLIDGMASFFSGKGWAGDEGYFRAHKILVLLNQIEGLTDRNLKLQHALLLALAISKHVRGSTLHHMIDDTMLKNTAVKDYSDEYCQFITQRLAKAAAAAPHGGSGFAQLIEQSRFEAIGLIFEKQLAAEPYLLVEKDINAWVRQIADVLNDSALDGDVKAERIVSRANPAELSNAKVAVMWDKPEPKAAEEKIAPIV